MAKSVVKTLVVGFPIGLVFMVIGSLLVYEYRRVDKQAETPMSQPLTPKGMVGHYKKLTEYLSPRGFRGKEPQLRLQQTESFIGGTLGYMNTGMNVLSENALTREGRIWKSYKLKFKGAGVKSDLHFQVNYVTASNEELAVAMALAEALPNQTLLTGVELIFLPDGETTLVPEEWGREARSRGAGNALCYDGVDWDYLTLRAKAFLKALQ